MNFQDANFIPTISYIVTYLTMSLQFDKVPDPVYTVLSSWWWAQEPAVMSNLFNYVIRVWQSTGSCILSFELLMMGDGRRNRLVWVTYLTMSLEFDKVPDPVYTVLSSWWWAEEPAGMSNLFNYVIRVWQSTPSCIYSFELLMMGGGAGWYE